ncbi:MAG: glycosyltransferase [Gemmatimonadota bacterium]
MSEPGADFAAGPELSIVIASVAPWPALRVALDSLRDQVAGRNIEVLVGCAHAQALDQQYAESFQGLTQFHEPGASVFWLRTEGISRARGSIIAITEDHCVAAPDWCEQILAAHARHPEFSFIGGSLDNGSPDTLIDWANYFVGNPRFMPPVHRGEATSLAMQANVAFKARAKPPVGSALGNMEFLLVDGLAKKGERFYLEPSIRVLHQQSHGFWNTFIIHFHSGRSIAGFRREMLSPVQRVARVATTPILPVWLVSRAWGYVIQKRRRRLLALAATPFMIGIGLCHAVGEVSGYLLGPGDSPSRIP